MTIHYQKSSLGMLFGMFLLISQAGHAATWSSSASACVPGDGSAGRFAFDEASLKFAGGSTGNIVVRCHVTNPFDDSGTSPIWNTLTVGYQDPDGNSTAKAYTVTAKLLRVDKDTGAVNLIRLFDSNVNGNTTLHTASQVSFTHNFDFARYAYYVTLSLDRAVGATLVPAVWYVKLSNAP
jgi:hypothetical protein